MSRSIVLSDKLLLEFYKFKHNEKCNSKLIERILYYYTPSHSTNISQLERLGICNNTLKAQLISSGYVQQTLEELATKTTYKIILSEDNDNFPYVNIFSDKIESNYTSTYRKGENKKKAKSHIKSFLENANTIFIYDRYMMDQWSNVEKFFDLLPKKNLTIYYIKNHLQQEQVNKLKRTCKDWKIKIDATNTTHRNLHDRYLIIDSQIEIIMTSGCGNIFDNDIDFTYMVKI